MSKTFRFQGEEAVLSDTKVADVRLPRIEPNTIFYLAVNPESWSVRFENDQPLLLPSFKQIHKLAGICENKEGDDINPSVSCAKRNGWQIIEHRHSPVGKSYVRKIETDKNGRIYNAFITLFDRVYAGSDTLSCDRAAMHKWVWSLVERDIISGPSLPALRRELAKCSRSLSSATNKAKMDYRANAQATMMTKAVAILKTEISKLESQETPIDLSDAEEVSL